MSSGKLKSRAATLTRAPGLQYAGAMVVARGKTAVVAAFGPQMWPGALTAGATDPAWGGALGSERLGQHSKVESVASRRKFSLAEHEG